MLLLGLLAWMRIIFGRNVNKERGKDGQNGDSGGHLYIYILWFTIGQRSANNLLNIRISTQDMLWQTSRWEEQEMLSGIATKWAESPVLIHRSLTKCVAILWMCLPFLHLSESPFVLLSSQSSNLSFPSGFPFKYNRIRPTANCAHLIANDSAQHWKFCL
jgi:hypothetical protein